MFALGMVETGIELSVVFLESGEDWEFIARVRASSRFLEYQFFKYIGGPPRTSPTFGRFRVPHADFEGVFVRHFKGPFFVEKIGQSPSIERVKN